MADIDINAKDIAKNFKEKKVLDSFKEVLSKGNSSSQDIDQFIQIMELPDEDFNKIYPIMKERIEAIYNNPAYEKEVLDNLKQEMMRDPSFNIDEQAAAAREFIDTIKDEEMGENKKNFLTLVLENAVFKFVEVYNNPREKISVKIEKIDPNAKIPAYAHPLDAGADISSCETITIAPGETKIIRTGLKVDIPRGYALLIYPRSGISAKTKLRIANSVGVVDSLYHKEIGVIIDNIGTEDFTINIGDRIAQFIIIPTPYIIFKEEKIEDNERGGFGSTGV